MKLIVTDKTLIATDTVRVRFADPSGANLPGFEPGAHIEVIIGGMTRRYSLTSHPQDLSYYEICVLRTNPSGGGSAYIHNKLAIGDTVEISTPQNAFPLNPASPHSVFIAGGIGITPFLSMTEALTNKGHSFELHYAARSSDRFLPLKHSANLYPDDEGKPTLDVEELINSLPDLSDIYVCGPRVLIETVRKTALKAGWPKSRIHFESFGPVVNTADSPVTLKLAMSDMTVVVEPGTTILDAMLEAGIWAPFECKRGECASCVTEVLGGSPDHRDLCLTDDQRRQNFCPCVSWATSDTLELNL